MRYLKPILFLTLTCLLMMGSGTKEVELTEGIQLGNLAPIIDLQDAGLGNENFILLQFWAAYNAQSRMLNVQMHNAISHLKKDNIQFISVSFDEDEAVFEGIVKADSLNPATQFNEPRGKESKIFKKYRLESGFNNWLINSKGIIVAKNVKPKEISDILNDEIRKIK